MPLTSFADAVIGLVAILWFFIRRAFTRTRCCICDDKIMSGELKYRVTKKIFPVSSTPGIHARNPVCTKCMNEVPKSSTTEIVCLNR